MLKTRYSNGQPRSACDRLLSWIIPALILLPLMVSGGASGQTFGSSTTPLVNQTYAFGPDRIHAFKIATLVAWGGSTFDHLHIIATANSNWIACCNAGVDLTFANRNGFTYFYTVHGAKMSPTAKIVAFANPDSSVDVYLVLGVGFVTGSYTVIENLQETVYSNPPDEGTTLRTDSPIFDSSSSATPPQQFIGFNGNMGFETQYPGSELSIVTGNPGSETGEHIVNTSLDGYSVIRLGTDSVAQAGSAWHQFNPQWVFDTASAYAPSSTAIAAFEANGLALVTTAAAPIRFFTSSPYAGGERMRLDPGGNLGIGTTTPAAKLDVAGNIKLSSPGAGIIFPDNSFQQSAITNITTNSGNGAVGIGTNNPQAALDVESYSQSNGVSISVHNASGEPQSESMTSILFKGGSPGDDKGIQTFAAIQSAGSDYDSNNGYLSFQTLTGGNLTEKFRITANGNIGVGTATPQASLDINGGLKLSGSGGTITFPDGTSFSTAAQPLPITQVNGNSFISGVLQVGGSTNPTTSTQGGYMGWNALTGGTGETDFINNQGSGTGGFAFFNTSASGSLRPLLMFITGAGNVGVGTPAPGSKLEVNGNVKLTSGSGASLTFADGTVQSTAYTGTCIAAGGDYAESVDVEGAKAEYGPGDLIIINARHNGFTKANVPYSPLVAGIYSTRPGYVGRRQQGDITLRTSEIPMAMIGIVPTKVTSENGLIHRGDLLVSSSTLGAAMKGTDRSKMLGSVIGKALEDSKRGNDVIEVLVTLQ